MGEGSFIPDVHLEKVRFFIVISTAPRNHESHLSVFKCLLYYAQGQAISNTLYGGFCWFDKLFAQRKQTAEPRQEPVADRDR